MILKFQENITEIPKKYRHMVKDFYKTPTGTWMIDLVDGYTTSYGTNYIENKYKKDCLYELMNEVSADEVIINMDESKNTKPINKEKIEEASRNELLALAKMQTKTRYEKAAGYKGFSIVDIDTSMLLRDDTITVTCNVGKYYDTIQLMDVLIWIQMESERNPNNQVNTKAITAALMEAIDALEIKVNCTCPDWCLEENTLIKLLNNEVVTIKELKDKFDNNEELWVYSTDKQGDFKPGKVTNVWISGKANKMVKVTLDNDKEIITTSNHKYMMRDGSYKKAEDLSENDSLMPLYFSYTNGYENVKRNSIVYPTRFDSIYKIVAETVLSKEKQEAKDRTGEDIIQIHHRDFNKLNNYPSNLYPMGKMEHWMYHSKLGGKNIEKLIEAGRRFWVEDPRRFEALAKQKRRASECKKEWWASMSEEEKRKWITDNAWTSTDEGRKIISQKLKKVWKDYSKEEKEARLKTNCFINNNPMTNKEFRNSEEFTKRNKNISKSLDEFHKITTQEQRNKMYGWAKGKTFDEDHKQKISKALIGKKFSKERIQHLKEGGKRQAQQNKESRCRRNLNELIQQGKEITPESFLLNRRSGDPHYLKVFNSFEEMLEKFNIPCNVNHKVKKVEYIYYDDPIDVYDLEVDNYHNFYVDAGVMLHNCYRFAYQATQLDYKYGKPENRPADITNPHNYGSSCKHLISLLSNKKWLQQVTGTIMDWVVKNIDKVNEFLRPKEGMELTLPNELARRNAKLGFYSKLFKDKLEDEPEEEVEDNVDNNNDTDNSNDNNDNVEDSKDNNQNNSNNINNDNSDDLDDSNINSDEEKEDNG